MDLVRLLAVDGVRRVTSHFEKVRTTKESAANAVQGSTSIFVGVPINSKTVSLQFRQRQTGLPHFPSPFVTGEGGGVPLKARRNSRLFPVAEIVRKVRPRQAPPKG